MGAQALQRRRVTATETLTLEIILNVQTFGEECSLSRFRSVYHQTLLFTGLPTQTRMYFCHHMAGVHISPYGRNAVA